METRPLIQQVQRALRACISHKLPGEAGAAGQRRTVPRLTAALVGWATHACPLAPIIRAVTSPPHKPPLPQCPGTEPLTVWGLWKEVCPRGRPGAKGLTYFLLASWSASDSSNFLASSRNFFILSFISLFLANSCLILSSKPERKPFLFPEE